MFACYYICRCAEEQTNKKIIIAKESYVSYLSPWPLWGHGEGREAGEAVNRRESVSCRVKMYRSKKEAGQGGNTANNSKKLGDSAR